MKRPRRCPEGQTRVIGYVRVSTQKQADSGLGLAAQERLIREECDRRGWCLLEVVSDRGRSAKTMSREGITTALESLRSGASDVLMVAKGDRATRNLRDVIDLMDSSVAEGWALVDLEMNFDTSTATGKALALNRAVWSQWEREIISERTKVALAEKKAQGVRLGRPSVVPSQSVERARSLKAQGMSVRAIAERLNTEGVPTSTDKAGKPVYGKWHPTTVQRALGASKVAHSTR